MTIIGGGVIGLATAWRLAQQGRSVVVCDPAPASAATHVAAGMLAPVTEVWYGEQQLLMLNLAAARGYASFVAELEAETGLPVGYRATGTLSVALDTGDRDGLSDLLAYQRGLGLTVEALSSRDCREREPLLAPGIRGGTFVVDDHSVDNRRLARALLVAVARRGVRLHPYAVDELRTGSDRVCGVHCTDGLSVAAQTVVLAAGPWSSRLAGVPPECVPPVRPVKGQILRLHTRGASGLSHTVRALVHGADLYLVPRTDGEVVVGATAEDVGFDTSVRADAVYRLVRDAHLALPGVGEWELTETSAGLRPGSPDNAPMIGPTSLPGLIVATGHYRNGILLAPLTADAVTALVTDGAVPELIAPFSPQRFDRTAA